MNRLQGDRVQSGKGERFTTSEIDTNQNICKHLHDEGLRRAWEDAGNRVASYSELYPVVSSSKRPQAGGRSTRGRSPLRKTLTLTSDLTEVGSSTRGRRWRSRWVRRVSGPTAPAD